MTEYSKVIAVTGLPGLYELISSKADGAIVRSLEDKSTRFISSRIYKVTQLETIEVFTVKDNVNLIEVFKAMESSGEKLPNDKDSDALSKYFKKSYPDLDFEKVYASDMKKMVKWFSVLHHNKIELKLTEPAPEEPVAEEKEELAVETEKKEVKKPAVKKAAPVKKEAEAPKKETKKDSKKEDKKETKKDHKKGDNKEEKKAKPKKAAPKAKSKK
jgi:hypothetical protein